MELSLFKLLLILLIVFLFFGTGKLPQALGDLGRGMRALRDGLKHDKDGPPDNSAT